MAAPQWEIRMSKSRQLPYFYDSANQVSSWEAPEALNETELRSLPGAHYLGSEGASGTGSAENEPSSVRASHILVKHAQSRRPSSHRQSVITRSPEEAQAMIQGFIDQLGPNPDPALFAKIASENSDCSSSRTGGDLGAFKRGQMQKPFEDAAYSLPVGGISGVVQTESGTHIILRTA